MTKPQIFFRVVLLQVVKRIVPPMSNEIITLVKDTSLAASITIAEMFSVAQQITAENYVPLLMYIIVALIYALFTTVLSRLQAWMEKSLAKTTPVQ